MTVITGGWFARWSIRLAVPNELAHGSRSLHVVSASLGIMWPIEGTGISKPLVALPVACKMEKAFQSRGNVLYSIRCAVKVPDGAKRCPKCALVVPWGPLKILEGEGNARC